MNIIGGEIDIIESRGNDHLITTQNEDIGCTKMGTTVHWGMNICIYICMSLWLILIIDRR